MYEMNKAVPRSFLLLLGHSSSSLQVFVIGQPEMGPYLLPNRCLSLPSVPKDGHIPVRYGIFSLAFKRGQGKNSNELNFEYVNYKL